MRPDRIDAALRPDGNVVRHRHKAVQLAHECPVLVGDFHAALGVILLVFKVVDGKVLHAEAHIVHGRMELVKGDIAPVLPSAELRGRAVHRDVAFALTRSLDFDCIALVGELTLDVARGIVAMTCGCPLTGQKNKRRKGYV